MTFVFGLTSFGARDFGGFPSSLWWIQTAFISTRSLWFTSSLELTFLRFWENPVLAREFLDSSQTMEWFVDSFVGYVHKIFVIVPAKFEPLWTCFDPPIIKFFKGCGLWNTSSARAGFFVIAGWTDAWDQDRRINRWVEVLAFRVFGLSAWLHRCISSICIGSTGEASPAIPACCSACCTGV